MLTVALVKWRITCGLVCLCFMLPTANTGPGKTINPKFITADGNLIIQSAINKNISFEVGEKNDILFSGTSLKTLAKSIQKQEKTIEKLQKGLTCKNQGQYKTADGASYCACQGDWYGIDCSIKKPTECEFKISSSVGIISSPGYPLAYPPDTECTWKIKAPLMQTIEVFVNGVGIGSSTSCGEADYLQVVDNGQVNRKFCGVSLIEELTTSNEMTVKFKTGPSRPVGPGFLLLYSVQENKICGGHLTSVAGIIESPEHTKPVICGWYIDAKAAEPLVLKFDVLNIVNDVGSCKNYLEIYAGTDSTSPLVRKICHSTGAITVNSPSSQAFIKFESNDTASTFRGSYDLACGGATQLKAQSFDLQSPAYPKLYPNKKTCTWHIKADATFAVAVRFKEFDVEPHPSCSYDTVAFYDGKSTSSRLLANYCGNQTPLPITTTDQNLMVVFQSDGDKDFHGFKATVAAVRPGCGGIISGDKGLIHAPPPPLPGTGLVADCLWTISSDKPGYGIQLFFPTFSLQSSTNCADEYIQIFEGQLENGNPTKFCGSNGPAVISTEKRSITVKFFTNKFSTDTEFYGEWKSVAKPAGCNIAVSGVSGTIQSVNYPNNYDSDLDCMYTISTENGHLINVTFDVFALEHHPTCVNDYLAIYDGDDVKAPLIDTFCGTRGPKTIVSSSNKLLLHFKTDLSGEDKGFHAVYSTGTNLCGGYLHQNSGFFSSPGYPRQYASQEDCVWFIQSDDGNFIDLTVIDFSLEDQPVCASGDYVRIYDGDNREANILAELCGDKEAGTRFRSTSHHLMIEFKSDNVFVSKRGFQFAFTSGCGEVFNALSGVIKTPNYPNNYPLARVCDWTINSYVNDVINIKSVGFELQDSPSCVFDYLQISGAKDGTKKYCGSQGPSQNFTSNKLDLKFNSDNRISTKGFSLTYTIIGCSADLTAPTGTFKTPNYPQQYPASSYCIWRITVAEGKRVGLNIPSITMSKCDTDSVTIYNGGDVKAPVLQTYCSQTIPVNLTSSSNMLTVLFKSSVANVGFSASYESVEGAGCGGTTRSTAGYINSPNYPSTYSANSMCTWKIRRSTPGTVKLTFEIFDLGASTDCTSTYLKVIDSITTQVIATLCGSSIPLPLASTSNEMDLTFASGTGGNKGFKIHYEKGCGGTIDIESIDSSGFINTPGFPNNYSEDVCVWHLKAKSGNKVFLTFDSFAMESADGNGVCNGDYLQIHNGDSTNAPLMTKTCGSNKPAAITSTGNSLYVKFFANKLNHFSGFKAEYASVFTGCGGDLTGYKGSIANSLFPDVAATAQYCEFNIRVADGSKVYLNFEVFDLVQSDLCLDTYLRVSEGSETVLDVCGTNKPPDFTSKSNIVKVLYSSLGTAGSKFKINYKTECNNLITSSRGTIQSPNYPNFYPHNSQCFWGIQAPQHIQVKIEFEQFSLEEKTGTSCKDHVQIFDEYYNELGVFCGSTVPSPITSPGQTLSMRFVSDGSTTSTGFAIKYSFTTDENAACGGIYNAATVPGYIATPNYPLHYPVDKNCQYQIDTTPGTSVKLTFLTFELEDYYCFYDHVSIYDGTKDNKLKTLCGTEGVNKTYKTSSTRMIVTFYSDENGVYKGFKAMYQRVCGGIRFATKDKISSPMQDGTYSNFENCTWIVQQTSGTVIKFYFTKFDLESSIGCTKDYLIVRNGLAADSPLIGRYCGNTLPANYTSSGNALFFQFVTDNTTVAGGFELIYERFVQGCGGTESLIDPTLTYTLTSPGYSNSYPDNIDCEWVLNVPEGHVVDFSINDFKSNFTCSSDYLILHAGPSNKYPLIGRFCGSDLPHQIHYKSSVNGMYVRLVGGVKPQGSAAYFSATWKMGCGGYYMEKSGEISSPSYPSQYPANSNCTYNIQVLGNKQVHLQFNTFSLFKDSTNTNCPDDGDYIEVYDGDHNKTKIGRYCGDTLPGPIIGLTDKLSITFISNGLSSSNGFQASFSTVGQVCGGNLYKEGTFQTPFYPLQYPLRRECIWILESTPGIKVHLKFESFDLESSVNCSGDHIIVRNGRRVDSPIIGTYCGSSLPPMLYSTGNHLVVIFVSDGSSNRGTGFKASFKSADIACGGEVSGKNGFIQSPGYPTGYTPDMDCEWKITVPKASIVQLTFVDIDMEPPFSGMCFDYVTVMEGGAVITVKCGQKIFNGYVYKSFGSEVSVGFKSDESENYPGFKALWQAVEPGCTDVVVPIKAGSIVNPGYPGPGYGNDLDCTWTWMERDGETIALQLFDIDLVQSPNCSVDSLIIRNGRQPDSPVLATLCGNKTESGNIFFVSSGQYMQLTFKTGNVASRTARGFKIGFTTRQAGCGGVLLSHNGTITSPNYPSPYPDSASCTWVIQTEVGSRIFLYIDDMDIEDHPNCDYDGVELRDGNTINTPLIVQLCGKEHHSVYESSSNYMFISFKTDMYNGGRGFKFHYNIGCGGVLKGKSGYTLSPNYPNQYPPNQDCRWTIDIPEDYHIKLTELDFDLPRHNDLLQCDNDYVQIRNGLNISSVLLATFCGKMENQQYESEYNKLFLQFVSDNITTEVHKGVKAHYVAVCGEVLDISETYDLNYPKYGGEYGKNESCVWTIKYPVGERIVVQTTALEIEAHRNFHCHFDYLEIRDGDNEKAPLYGRFCGTQRPPVFRSTGNTLYVKFVSDASIAKKGFSMRFSKTIPEGTCGGAFTASSGNITSPGYPNAFSMNLDCGYRITQPEGTRINLTFTKFMLTIPNKYHNDYRDCVNYIKVYDAPFPDENVRRVNITCGNQTGLQIQSLGRDIYVLFHSYDKAAGDGDGFLINYVAHTTECGAEVKLKAGETTFLTSPGYPADIVPGSECHWLLTAPVGYQLKSTLQEIDFPKLANNSCPRTYLKVHDGVRGTALALCGDIQGETLQSSMHAALLILVREVVGKPFKIRLELVEGCNQTITDSSGMIMSPNFPYSYLHAAECHYFVTAPPGQKITLYPILLNIEHHKECKYDYLEINDGADRNAPMLGKQYCGEELPSTFSSSGNKMHLFLKSDGAVAKAGFAFSYTMSTAACGGNVTGEIGAITSPKYPQLYAEQYECEWDIMVPSTMKINITMLNFELQSPAPGDDCSTVDYLEIVDGTTSLGKFCGLQHLSKITSISNKVKVIFVSNSDDNMYRGFRLTYHATLSS